MFSKTSIYLSLFLIFTPIAAIAQISGQSATKYGANPTVGKVFNHDGVKLYYEIYGTGEPLLIIHGNGASIWTLRAQINYFREKYKVIVMDSRDHGRSSDSPIALSFETMTDDLAALLDHLHVGPAYILGWSDGGIEALLLGMRHPETVKMIATMAANLDPSGVYPEVLARSDAPAREISADKTENLKAARAQRVEQLDRNEPHINPEALRSITVPTLVLAGDHDIVIDEHTLLIYHHLPKSELVIFPGATHMIPFDDPALFNTTVDHFFSKPFVKTDRFLDTMQSYQKMLADFAAEK